MKRSELKAIIREVIEESRYVQATNELTRDEWPSVRDNLINAGYEIDSLDMANTISIIDPMNDDIVGTYYIKDDKLVCDADLVETAFM